MNQIQHVVRIEAAREDDHAVDHRGDAGGHGLPEHVAEREQIEESERMERLGVLPILHHLAFDRDDVRQHVPVADDDAFGLGRRARRENDLDDIVP
jgi:hypothetical protein